MNLILAIDNNLIIKVVVKIKITWYINIKWKYKLKRNIIH